MIGLLRGQSRGGRSLKVMIHGHADGRLVVLLLEVDQVRRRRRLNLALPVFIRDDVAAEDPSHRGGFGESESAGAAKPRGYQPVAPGRAVHTQRVRRRVPVVGDAGRPEPPERLNAPPRVVAHPGV